MKFDFSRILTMHVSEPHFSGSVFAIESLPNTYSAVTSETLRDSMYKINLLDGTVKKIVFSFDMKYITKNEFSQALRDTYHNMVYSTISEEFESFPAEYGEKLKQEAKEEKALPGDVKKVKRNIELVNERLTLLKTVYSDCKKSESKTVKAIASILYNGKLPNEFNALVKPCAEELAKLESIQEEEDVSLPLKNLRVALDNLAADIWQEDTSAGILKYRYTVNATLTWDVFRAVYSGRKLDKSGFVKRNFKYSALERELVLAMIQRLARLFSEEEQARKDDLQTINN